MSKNEKDNWFKKEDHSILYKIGLAICYPFVYVGGWMTGFYRGLKESIFKRGT